MPSCPVGEGPEKGGADGEWSNLLQPLSRGLRPEREEVQPFHGSIQGLRGREGNAVQLLTGPGPHGALVSGWQQGQSARVSEQPGPHPPRPQAGSTGSWAIAAAHDPEQPHKEGSVGWGLLPQATGAGKG